MAGVNGTSVLLQIRTSTGPDVYTTLASQRGMKVSRKAAEIDMSSKDGADFVGQPGRRESSLSFDGLYVPSDLAKAALVTSYETGAMTKLRRTAVGADPARTADCFVTSYEEDFPDQDASTVSFDLKVSGAWA